MKRLAVTDISGMSGEIGERMESRVGGDGGVSISPGGGQSSIPMRDLSPVFLVSSFRTASTWLWSKLRSAPTTLAYYEIYNEILATIDASGVAAMDRSVWRSKHPDTAPYFLEFLPLLRGQHGVPGYDVSMSIARFIPENGIDGELHVTEVDYIQTLVEAAHAIDKIPVISCTRMLGRARAIRKAFLGRIVFCYRNPFHQWASYCGQAIDGNPFFLQMLDLTLKNARHDPFLAMVDDLTRERIVSPGDEVLFQAFLLVHFYLSVHAYEASDLTVDVSAIARDPSRRHAAELRLSEIVGVPIDLSDVDETFEVSLVAVRSVDEFSSELHQMTKIIHPACRTEMGRIFLKRMCSETLSEWRRHEFFAERSRIVHAREHAELSAKISALEQELQIARDAVLAQQQPIPSTTGGPA